MPTYTAEFDYSLHASARVTHKLVVVEESVDVLNHYANVRIYIERSNSGREHDANGQSIQLKINDETVGAAFNGTPILAANSSDIIELRPKRTEDYYKVPYNDDGTKPVNIELTYKSESVGLVVTTVWGTTATAELTFSLSPIDMSLPTISDISVKADRYGRNASARFKVSHNSYNLFRVEFKLNNLTYQQAKCRDLWYDSIRNGNIENPPTNVDKNYNGVNEDGDCYIRLIKESLKDKEVEFYFPLDDFTDDLHPLDSGGSYPWELTVTAYNNKTETKNGVLKVPQKVTGVDCESRLDINPGQNAELDYSVNPSNAELLDVTFTSSNTQIATVDENGTITGIAEGPCNITVKTVDGGYTATCLVYVLDSSVYPILEPLERYFKASHFNRMILATEFIKLEIEERSGAVPDFEIIYFSGRAEKVFNIFPMLQSFFANCGRLRAAAETIGVSVGDLPEIKDIIKVNAGWQIILNEWISFLNRLHEKINGG